MTNARESENIAGLPNPMSLHLHRRCKIYIAIANT
jgi:hypothetical protein